MIAATLGAVLVYSSHQCVHFRFVEIMDDCSGGPLEGDRTYLAAPSEMFRATFAYEESESMNPGEALIVRIGAAVPHLLEISQEGTHQIGGQLGYLNSVDRPF